MPNSYEVQVFFDIPKFLRSSSFFDIPKFQIYFELFQNKKFLVRFFFKLKFSSKNFEFV